MPTHRQLHEEATTLADELGVDVRLAGMTHRELQDLVDELKQCKEAQGQRPPPAATKPAPTPPKPPQGKPPRERQITVGDNEIVVAEGTSITSLRGVLGPGTVVTADCFIGGQQTVDDLLANGTLVTKSGRQADGDGAA